MSRESAKELLGHYLKSVKEGCPDDADNHCEIECIVDEICDVQPR